MIAAFMISSASSYVHAQKPQLASTPPMGWNSWNHFRCHVSDPLVRAQADAMVRTGMRAAGYVYVNIDDCWQGERDAGGVIHPSAQFPDMKGLADYLHNKGLKLGIYSSPGPRTCDRYEGSYGHEIQDAQTYADWGVDFLKYDWCKAGVVYKTAEMPGAFEKMHEALQRTGRPIVYSIHGGGGAWRWGPAIGANLWRTTGDITDTYARMALIGFGQSGLENLAGPGHWNDPDMLEIGNGGISHNEYRMHLTLWCLLAAPLIAGNDLTVLTPQTLENLTNPDVIAVDQDAAGIQVHRVWQEGPLEIWMKPLADGSKAVGLFNREQSTINLTVYFRDLGIGSRARVRDLWGRRDLGDFRESYSAEVPEHGAVLIKLR
jgi:alpha-galactosidase